jgi:lipopolysaccharide cholinephosphotransferase
MPRRDYERLAALWKKKADTKRYELSKSDAYHIDRNLFLTIRDSETTQIKPYQDDLDIPHGLPLDILPLDGYPDKKSKRIIQCFWALVYSVYCAQTVPENHGKSVKMIGNILLKMVPSRNIRYRIWKFAEKQMTKYSIKDCDSITELCSGPHYMKKRYPKEAFESAVWKAFEDTEMPIPAGYDSYLKIAFGDYMKMPPKEKQKPHHDTKFLDMDHSYKQYKGKFYCVKGK